MIRSIRAAAGVAFLLATVAACTGGAAHPAARATTPPSSPSSTPAPGTATKQVSIGPLQLALPLGWKSSSDDSFANVCITPPATHATAFGGCGGLDIWYGWDGFLPGNEMSTFDRADPGWYHGTGVGSCPVDPTKGRDGLNGINTGALVGGEQLRPVGNRKAYFYEWGASCDSGYRFTPRAWYLPASKILVFDYLGNDAADAILDTATFDRGHWTFGFLDGATQTGTGVKLAFDEAQWLGADAANDYASKHGMQTPVPNDYLIVDPDTSTTPYPIAHDARVVSVFALAGTEPGKERVVSVAQLVTFLHDRSHWSVPFHVHVDASGRIDQVIEQYRP